MLLDLVGIGAEHIYEIVIRAILLRWTCQEDSFKHGNERWGINQLDGRRVRPYPEDAIIPNPARRRLDHQLRLVRAAEGKLRGRLATSNLDAVRREELDAELRDNLARQRELMAQRPRIPARAPLRETVLADRLQQHEGKLKTVVDTVRVALANCESALAIELAPLLRKPREAKKTLANLFAAPGHVRVNRRSIAVRLSPAGTRREIAAFGRLLDEVNARAWPLPGDLRRRPLRFTLAPE